MSPWYGSQQELEQDDFIEPINETAQQIKEGCGWFVLCVLTGLLFWAVLAYS